MSEPDLFSTQQAQMFTPFWRRLPSFFTYPMQMGSLLRITLCSVIGGISFAFPHMARDSIQLVLWIVFLKYGMVAMRRTANGHFDEPDGLDWHEYGDMWQVLRLVTFLFLIGLLGNIFGKKVWDFEYTISWIFVCTIAPAGIMIITMKRSLLMALNPILIYGYIKVVGAPFIALGFVLLSLYESSQWFQHTALKFHSWIKYPLLSFAEFYFALVAFNLMGYVVYQYHAALGEHASVSYEEAYAKIAPREVTDQTLRELSSLLANGQQDAAIELLYEKLFLKWDDNDLHERYHKLLIATGKNLRAINHARAFINKLVIEKRFFKAMDLFEECLMIDSEFKLQDSFQVYELASAANVAKRYQLALDLLNDFDKKYPSHQHTPQVYFLNALIVSEKFQRNVEALQLFHTLKSKYPNHPLALESDNHIAAISKTNLIS